MCLSLSLPLLSSPLLSSPLFSSPLLSSLLLSPPLFKQQTAIARKGASDEIPSTCCIFYDYTDSYEATRLYTRGKLNHSYSVTSVNPDELKQMADYCINPKKCRQNLLMKPLKGEPKLDGSLVPKRRRCGSCDNCERDSVRGKSVDVTTIATRIFNHGILTPHTSPLNSLVP